MLTWLAIFGCVDGLNSTPFPNSRYQ